MPSYKDNLPQNPTLSIDTVPTNGSTNPVTSDGVFDALALKQDVLTNPVTGTGTSGQVSYFNGTSAVTGSANLFWDNANNRLGINQASPGYTIDITGTGRITGIVNTLGYSFNVQRLQFNNGVIGTNFGYIRSFSNGVFSFTNAAESDFDRLSFGGTTSSFPSIGKGSGNGNLYVLDASAGTSANLGIGLTQATSLSARLHVRGSGTTSSTTALLVQNGTPSTILAALDSRTVYINSTTSYDGALEVNLGNHASRLMKIGPFEITTGAGATWTGQGIRVDGANRAFIFNVSNSNTTDLFAFSITGGGATANDGFSARTTGTIQWAKIEGASFLPTSGTAQFTQLAIAGTINQTGGANGITRGLYVNPTLTAAADWRSIETTNNTGYAIYASGSANSYFGGNVGIGTTTPTEQLHIVKTSQVSTRETILKAQISDAGNDAFLIANGTSLNNIFWPVFCGFGTNVNRSGLQFLALANATSDSTGDLATALLSFEARKVSSDTDPLNSAATPISNKAILGVFNQTTPLLSILPSGNISMGTGGLYTNSARLHIRGSGTTSSTTALLVQNSTPSELFRILDDGNIGINTSSPTAKLHIVGADNLTNRSVQVLNQQGAGIFSIANDRVVQIGDWTAQGYQATLTFIRASGGSRSATFNQNNTDLILTNPHGGFLVNGLQTTFRGSGTTSSTTALLVQNSASTELFKVLDNGAWNFNGDGIILGGIDVRKDTGNIAFFAQTNGSIRLQVEAAGRVGLGLIGWYPTVNRGNSITTGSGGCFIGYDSTSDLGYNNVPSVTIGRPLNRLLNATSGTQIMVSSVGNYSPTSGTGQFILSELIPTINQTGGANGITRGLYVNPTLTSAADWRSLEWSNNTGWGLYGAGTATNYLGGNTAIGTTTTSGGRLTVRGSGTTSSTTALLVQNSGATELFKVKDNGDANFGTGMYWDNANGRLGIGTASPSVLLHSSGIDGSYTNVFRLTNTANLGTTLWANTVSHDIQFHYTDPSMGSVVYGSIRAVGNPNSGAISGGTIDTDLSFLTGGYDTGGGLTEKFRIKATGQIRFLPRATAPNGAQAGDVYYNSTDNKHYGYDGTTWNAFY